MVTQPLCKLGAVDEVHYQQCQESSRVHGQAFRCRMVGLTTRPEDGSNGGMLLSRVPARWRYRRHIASSRGLQIRCDRKPGQPRSVLPTRKSEPAQLQTCAGGKRRRPMTGPPMCDCDPRWPEHHFVASMITTLLRDTLNRFGSAVGTSSSPLSRRWQFAVTQAQVAPSGLTPWDTSTNCACWGRLLGARQRRA